MLPILTVTLNPALDITSHVAELMPRQKLRCTEPIIHAGGGGVNVSRAILELDGQSRAFIALGGHTGARFEEQLRLSRIPTEIWPLNGETRTSFTVMEDHTGLPFRFVMPGPILSPSEASAILDRLERTIGRQAGYVVASGSLPPGVPVDFYARLAVIVRQAGAKLILDTHGKALQAATAERPYLVRLNHLEAQELVGGDADKAAHRLASELVEHNYAQVAIVTLGDRGAILATADEQLEIRPPHVEMKSGVGAGDSFVGALVVALASGRSIQDAARYGVAAAASAVTTDATELCRRADVDAFYSQTVMVRGELDAHQSSARALH
jgi:6-phosphofructokinase 2